MNTLWTDIATAAGVELSPEQLGRLDAYLDLLIEKNKVLNLTRIVDRTDAEIKHVADALTLLPYLPPVTAKWPSAYLADVGTGGGVPGVIIAIARPDIAVTLIDATKKKLDAVAEMAAAVGVRNVKTLHTRMEQANQEFDVITARGVASMNQLLLWCKPILKPAGTLLALKGPKAAEEIEFASGTLKRYRWHAGLVAVDRPELPGHQIVVVKRSAKPVKHAGKITSGPVGKPAVPPAESDE
jgi:16S rRNA (guanine527-N7)-methyltransferase